MELQEKTLEKIKSIKSDVEISEVKNFFLDEAYVRPPAEKLYRMDGKLGRYYVSVDGDKPRFLRSVTSIIDRYHKKSDFLVEWMAKDIDAAKKKFRDAGRYGTFIHILWRDIATGQQIDISTTGLAIRLSQYADFEGFDFAEVPIREWSEKAKKDVMGFIQWMQDYKVKPYVVEQTYSCPTHAGTIDFVGEITVGKEKIVALVDFKSGSEWDEHSIQLEGYVDLWKTNNRDLDIKKVYNYYAKDYRLPLGGKVKPYKFVDQTENKLRCRWQIYLMMNTEEEGEYNPEPEYRIKDMVVDAKTDFESSVERFDIGENFMAKKEEKNEGKNKRGSDRKNSNNRKNKNRSKKPVVKRKRNPAKS